MVTPLVINTRGSTRPLWNFDNSLFFVARQLSPKFFPFVGDNRATPVQDTEQRRHRRMRAAGTRSKVSFQIKALRKPFLLSLVVHILRRLNTTEKDADVIGMWPCQDIARTWTPGVY